MDAFTKNGLNTAEETSTDQRIDSFPATQWDEKPVTESRNLVLRPFDVLNA